MTDRRGFSFDARPSAGFVRDVLVVVAIVALTYLAWRMREAFLLAFAGIIIAVLLIALAAPLKRWTPLSHRQSVGTAAVLILVVVGLVVWLMGAQLSSQIGELTRALPPAVTQVEQKVGLPARPPSAVLGSAAHPGTSRAPAPSQTAAPPAKPEGATRGAPAPEGNAETGLDASEIAQTVANLPYAGGIAGALFSFGTSAVKVIASVILIAIAGVFLALDPDTYRRGLVQLFPRDRHRDLDNTLRDCGKSLYFWMLGTLISMALVGILVGLGTWLVGLSGPLALGLFAGLAEFLPLVGPFIGAAPAVLLAIAQGWSTFLWTVILFIVIQQLESNMIMPIVQRKMVTVPPALFLISVMAFGLLFGTLGVIVAGPLTVVAFVLVKKLWVRDTLGEDTHVPGERAAGPL